MSEEKIGILLVDDHQVLRDGLQLLLESMPNLDVVGEAADGQQAIKLTDELLPDLIVMDLGLPDMSGIEVSRIIKKNHPSIKIVVLSMHTRREFVIKSIEAGVDGYVPKSSTHESLLDAIQMVQTGERYLHPLAATALVKTYTAEAGSAEQRYQDLTEREQEVIQLAAMGYTSREIGEKLIISPKTVDTYRQRAFEKLGIEHRSDLVRFAVNIGILDDLKD